MLLSPLICEWCGLARPSVKTCVLTVCTVCLKDYNGGKYISVFKINVLEHTKHVPGYHACPINGNYMLSLGLESLYFVSYMSQ